MMEARYIPYSEREKYESEGWTVTPTAPSHHNHYSQYQAIRKVSFLRRIIIEAVKLGGWR